MSRIKYINSKKFFAKEYKDGIIVAFKNIGDNNTIYADQIHQIVSKYLGVDLFASDISESISCTENHKGSIKDSLFIYVKNGVSISAWGINICPNKYGIDVKYNSEEVLKVTNCNLEMLWIVCFIVTIVVLCVGCFAIIGYNTKVFDVPAKVFDVPVQKENLNEIIKQIKKDIIVPENANEMDDETPDSEENLSVVTNERHFEDKKHVGTKEQLTEDTTYTMRKRSEVANEHLRIADRAFVAYVESLDESEGINASAQENLYELAKTKAVENLRTGDLVSAKSRLNLLKSYIDDSNYNEYQDLLKQFNDSVSNSYNKANSLREKKQYQLAIIEYQRLIGRSKEPLVEPLYAHIGYCYEMCSEEELARNNYQLGIKYNEKLSVSRMKKLESRKEKEKHSSVEYKRKHDKENAERKRIRNALKAEAKEYVRIADQSYAIYVENFDETKGIQALTNYRKALAMAREHNLFFVHEKEKIEQCIKALEKEIK